MTRRLTIMEAVRRYHWSVPMALILRLVIPPLFDVGEDE
jgi:hypothetical protein